MWRLSFFSLSLSLFPHFHLSHSLSNSKRRVCVCGKFLMKLFPPPFVSLLVIFSIYFLIFYHDKKIDIQEKEEKPYKKVFFMLKFHKVILFFFLRVKRIREWERERKAREENEVENLKWGLLCWRELNLQTERVLFLLQWTNKKISSPSRRRRRRWSRRRETRFAVSGGKK